MDNIFEILKDKPKGTKLYSPIFGECSLDHTTKSNGEIWVKYKSTFQFFDKYGRHYKEGECLLFPSKEMQDWKEYQQLKTEFKDGDILYSTDYICSYIYIYREPQKGIDICYCYKITGRCLYICDTANRYDCTLPTGTIIEKNTRLATDSEKQQLFNALAKEGKAWDAEKKQIVDLPKKCELKPFDKVLVKDGPDEVWKINIYSSYKEEGNCHYLCIDTFYKYCIPYAGNEHLLGTNNKIE